MQTFVILIIKTGVRGRIEVAERKLMIFITRQRALFKYSQRPKKKSTWKIGTVHSSLTINLCKNPRICQKEKISFSRFFPPWKHCAAHRFVEKCSYCLDTSFQR